ncbi:nucleolar protein 12 isoform X2 [Aquarana catesbeiana]|uniref:nucleolar protein 12 isoform X2 n=1 Tax=Aquarana catesbeiana TaxID=8400 RepID=UPI003CC9DB24
MGKRKKVFSSRRELVFDEEKRKEYLTGFHKRKLQRRKAAVEEIKQKIKEEQKRMKEERHKEYMKMLKEREEALEEADEIERLVTAKTESVLFDHPNHTVTVTTISDLDLSGVGLLPPGSIEFPSTPQEWQTVASHFAQRWDFPNCGGAIDGKHVHIVPPPNSGSYYYNYKGFNSIVMLEVVSANYDFLYVDVGKNGRMSDGGVIAQTEFYRRLQNGSLDLPAPEDNVEGLPFVFVADEAFALGDHLMRPFPMRALTP